jgi:hypothetical protein
MYQFLDEQDMWSLVEKIPKRRGCLKNIIQRTQNLLILHLYKEFCTFMHVSIFLVVEENNLKKKLAFHLNIPLCIYPLLVNVLIFFYITQTP